MLSRIHCFFFGIGGSKITEIFVVIPTSDTIKLDNTL